MIKNMDMYSEKFDICSGCSLSVYHTDRFKCDTLKLSIAFPADADDKKTALFGLMINVLRNGTEKYPTRADITKRLNDLYDSSCSIGGFASGDNRILEISAEMLNDEYVFGEKVFDGICELMYQMLFKPTLDKNGFFVYETVEREKNVILDKIKSEKNNSKSYAFRRCREIMCDGVPYGMSIKPEFIKKITQKEITEFYKNFIENANIKFSYVGKKKGAEVSCALNRYFGKQKFLESQNLAALSAIKSSEMIFVEEELDIKQGVLVLGMTTGMLLDSELSYVMPVFNNIYGGTYTSRLFKTVREEMSLCYYCDSDYVNTKGVLFVSCGIDVNNVNKAQKAILDELNKLKLEGISEKELEIAKKLTIKELREMLDFPSSIASFRYGREIYGINMTIEELINKVSTVTSIDIKNVAKKIEPNTVFFLKGTLAGAEDCADE